MGDKANAQFSESILKDRPTDQYERPKTLPNML